jgi:hypothetical protein
MVCDEKAARGLGGDPHAADANWRGLTSSCTLYFYA